MSQSGVVINLPTNYGYVILMAVSFFVLLQWAAIRVGQARKRFNVQYPTMYAPSSHPDAKIFNCYQRAHQNCLEWIPLALVFLLIGGIDTPLTACLGGLVWIYGRVRFILGYSTGDPKQRRNGESDTLGLLIMMGCAVGTALRLTLRSA